MASILGFRAAKTTEGQSCDFNWEDRLRASTGWLLLVSDSSAELKVYENTHGCEWDQTETVFRNCRYTFTNGKIALSSFERLHSGSWKPFTLHT